MTEDVKIDQANPEQGVMDIVNSIDDNQRAKAIDATTANKVRRI